MSFISISDIISGYITDKSTDTISSIFSKISQSEQIKKNIDEQLKEELNKFQAASKNEEFDFEALQNFVKKFSDKSFINDYAKYSITKTELEKAQEHLFIECTQATHAETTDAQNTIKSILNNCFKIVEYQLILELSKEDLTHICLINKYTEGSAIKSVNDINKHGDENTKKIINEIKIIKNELIPSPTSSSSNNELSFDTLKVGRELSAEYLKNLITYGRFKGYDETNKERITIKNKLKTEKNSKKEYDLSEIVFSSSENIDKDCNISIHGVGGTGKTFQLISLYESIISNSTSPYNHTIPFYIELNNLNTNNSILLDELKSSLENDNVTTLKMEHLIKILKEQGRNVILMLDGYNEVTKEKLREEIAKQICKIIRDYKTRILITSRFDHSDMFQRINRGSTASFIQAEIQPCSPSQINIYFQKLKIYNKKFQNLQGYEKRLVKTAQGLSMYGALLKNNPKHKIENLGTLLREYVNNILLSDVKDTKFENYLEEIAYHMVLEGSFQIEPYELKEFLNKKYNNNTYDIVINDPNIQKLFVKDSKDNFEFTHQNFRDMYCALHFNKLLSNITKNFSGFKGNNITTNDEILQLCGDLIKNDQIIQKSINKLKEIQKNINKAIISNTDYSFALQVLIKIFSFKNKNNIHSLDLSTLDLSKVSLSGYILYQKVLKTNDTKPKFKTKHIQLLPTNCTDSNNCTTVSEDTFESNGLIRGSSTICKYNKDNNDYIVAFCSDNLVIYDTTTAKWKSIRYQFQDTENKFGWINCACNIEEEQKIILGTDNGFVTFFSYKDEPYINTDPKQYLQYDAIYKSQKREKLCCIESIVQFKDENSKTIILASNSAGEIFVLDDKKIIKSSNYPEIYSVQKQFYDDYELEKFSVCKLTINNQYMFYSWENKIFQCKLSKNIHFTRWTTLKQPCIFDIYCTNEYLFVNTGKEILVFSIDDKQNIASYSYSPPNDNITRHDQLNRFTKLSKYENYSNKVIIGTSAEDQDRNTIPNYIVLTVDKYDDDDDDDEKYYITPNNIFGIEQTMTTFSAVTFKQSDQTFIATTSNDRTVQIISANIEDFRAIRHPGTYDGIHHIEIISQTELLLSQYDGSVSHWKYNKKNQKWLCKDVYPIHTDWVWKARYYNDKYFFSCSYDGTVKRTNMITYETDTLIEDNDKIIDLALVSKEEKLYIYAVTEEKIIVYCLNDEKKDYIQFKDRDNLYTQYTGTAKYAIKSISHSIGEDPNKLLLAVNFYANGQKDLSNLSKIYELNISVDNKINDISTINGQSLNNYIKIDDITTYNDSLIITGQRKINDKKSEQIDVYKSEFETYNFSKIKSLSDFEERRIIYITFKEGNIFIGCLDGSVFILEKENITAQRTLLPTFLTHADLIAISSIDMEGVKWNNDQHKDRFKGYFKNL